jgi:hypothetical protein
MPPVRRIENLAQAISAGSDVRRYQRGLFPGFITGAKLEPRVPARIQKYRFEALNKGVRRLSAAIRRRIHSASADFLRLRAKRPAQSFAPTRPAPILSPADGSMDETRCPALRRARPHAGDATDRQTLFAVPQSPRLPFSPRFPHSPVKSPARADL